MKPARTVVVGFLSAKVHFTGDLIDLSESGALVRTPQHVEPQTVGRLGIDVGAETFRTVAIVSRNVPGLGVAFVFSNMTPHARELLQHLLHHLAARASS